LCVACTVFDVPHEADVAPDLWEPLSPVVCRDRKKATSSCFAVADSKALKLANSVKQRHPLYHLELGVLAFGSVLQGSEGVPATDAELLGLLHAEPGDLPWYRPSAEIQLPIGTTGDHLSLLSSRLRARCEAVGISAMEMRCTVTCEKRFNDDLRRSASKAALSFERVGALVRRVWRSEAAREENPARCPRVVVDRQGGRTRYAQALAHCLPDATVDIVGESDARSVYDLSGDGRRVRVSFEVEAEARHLPVALASMTAKLTRELLVARLNSYWSGRCAELKPTAGYAADGGRFLRDLADIATTDELRLLRRNA
jgi:hypothetical protein